MQIGDDDFLFMGLDGELYQVYFVHPDWHVARVSHLETEDTVSSEDCLDED